MEHYAVPTVLNTFRFEKSHRAVTVLCPFTGGEPFVRSVEASGEIGADGFEIVLSGGRRVSVRE